jgi:hypothetical protein
MVQHDEGAHLEDHAETADEVESGPAMEGVHGRGSWR